MHRSVGRIHRPMCSISGRRPLVGLRALAVHQQCARFTADAAGSEPSYHERSALCDDLQAADHWRGRYVALLAQLEHGDDDNSPPELSYSTVDVRAAESGPGQDTVSRTSSASLRLRLGRSQRPKRKPAHALSSDVVRQQPPLEGVLWGYRSCRTQKSLQFGRFSS